MAVVVAICVVVLVAVLASPVVLLVAAVIGCAWLLYAGFLLIGKVL